MTGDPGIEDGAEAPDEPGTSTAEQALTQTVIDVQNFGGALFAEDHHFATLRTCDPGFIRSGATPTTTWQSALGGFCLFEGWVTPSNPTDCRALMLAHTPGGFSNGTCTTFVTEVPGGAYSYFASGTNSAQVNTVNRSFALSVGQTLTIGTCGVAGASFSGDTYLRLNGPGGTQVASSDDACGLGSRIVLVAPTNGVYEIRSGCFSSNACSGTVVWTIQ